MLPSLTHANEDIHPQAPAGGAAGGVLGLRVYAPRRMQNYEYCWIVDPLDGTKEFIKRVPHFTVNVALVRGSAPVMGVVYTPAADTTHFAIKGCGAFVRCGLPPTPPLPHSCMH